MADAYWIQLGGNPTFALEVDGRIVGVTYWLDSEALGDGAGEQSAPPESGWYFVAVTRPRDPERVAEGLEIREGMAEEEMAQNVHHALEVIANESSQREAITSGRIEDCRRRPDHRHPRSRAHRLGGRQEEGALMADRHPPPATVAPPA
jgi:hypothetical protein